MKALVRKLGLVPLFLSLLTAIASPVWAGGLWLYEQGTPDLATASAGRMALAENAATASHNPAGMTRLDESQLMVGAQPLWLRIKFDPDAETTTTGSNGEDDPLIGAGHPRCRRLPVCKGTVLW